MSLWSRLFAGGSEASVPEPPPVSPSRSLGRMIGALAPKDEDDPRPELLLLGPPRGPHIEFFTHRGFRVTVEDLSEFFEWSREAADGPGGSPPALAQPADHFDAAVLFDVLDRLADEAARAVLAAVASVVRPGGQLFLLSDSQPEPAPQPPSKITFEGEGFRVEPGAGRPYRRQKRPNRDLLALFKGLTVQQMQLRKDGIREVLLRRPTG